MNTLKKLPLFLFFSVLLFSLNAQYKIEPREGYTPQIGTMVTMMEDLKSRISEEVKDLNQEETDFLIDERANSIGSLIMHLAATEAYYQVETLEERSWTVEEQKFWVLGGELGDESRAQLKSKPIQYYLDLWSEVRVKSLEGLKKRDDVWFAAEIEEGINNHYAWYHVMEHSANHMGQISLIKNKLK